MGSDNSKDQPPQNEEKSVLIEASQIVKCKAEVTEELGLVST